MLQTVYDISADVSSWATIILLVWLVVCRIYRPKDPDLADSWMRKTIRKTGAIILVCSLPAFLHSLSLIALLATTDLNAKDLTLGSLIPFFGGVFMFAVAIWNLQILHRLPKNH